MRKILDVRVADRATQFPVDTGFVPGRIDEDAFSLFGLQVALRVAGETFRVRIGRRLGLRVAEWEKNRQHDSQA